MNDILSIHDLTVRYRGRRGSRGGTTTVDAVRGVSLTVGRGETVALVGESGSGKTSIGRAVLGLHGRSATVSGTIVFDGTELVRLPARARRPLYGTRISSVPQDPLASLSPLHTVVRQVSEVLRVHGIASGDEARERSIQALRLAGLDRAEQLAGRYPHELSGGQRQRVLIAMAIVAGPDLVVADEPTSALDVTVQRRILDHLGSLVESTGASLVLITHDLAVAGDRADRIVVLSEGQVVEEGSSAQVLDAPQHPYTRALVAAAPGPDSRLLVRHPRSAPEHGDPGGRPQGSRDPDDGPQGSGDAVPGTASTSSAQRPVLLVAEGLRKEFSGARGQAGTLAVDDVTLTLRVGDTLGLVGESGSGKTTTARILLGLTDPDAGTVALSDLGADPRRPQAGADERPLRPRDREFRRRVQPVFQDPYSSLDPSHTVGRSVLEPVRSLGQAGRRERQARLSEVLDAVRLPSSVRHRRPYELSGGQLQRVAIARALSIRPHLLVCDEPVSSLDVTVQAQVLELLASLHDDTGLTYVLVSHDLAVVRLVCERVAVMRDGRVVEEGLTEQVFASPSHAWTRELVAAVPGGGRTRPSVELGRG